MDDSMADNELTSMHYDQLSNQEIDDIIKNNLTFIVENLKVNELLNGRHIFDKIIPDQVLSELRVHDQNLKLRQAKLFLMEYLKSEDPGKGQVLKCALRETDNETVRRVFSSKTTDTDLAAHSNEGYALENFRCEIMEQLDCDTLLLEECYSRKIITEKDKQEIKAGSDKEGSWFGICKLLDCLKKTHHHYSKFLKVLWDLSKQELVRKIDLEKYEKLKARDQDGDDEQHNYTEYSSREMSQENGQTGDPTYCNISEGVNNLNQYNIPYTNDLDGPIASRTRSKTKNVKKFETTYEGSGDIVLTATIAVKKKKSENAGKQQDFFPGRSLPEASAQPEWAEDSSEEENSDEKGPFGFQIKKYSPPHTKRSDIPSQTSKNVENLPKQCNYLIEVMRRSTTNSEGSDKVSNVPGEISAISTGCMPSLSLSEEMTHRHADYSRSDIGECGESFTDNELKNIKKTTIGFQSPNTLKLTAKQCVSTDNSTTKVKLKETDAEILEPSSQVKKSVAIVEDRRKSAKTSKGQETDSSPTPVEVDKKNEVKFQSKNQKEQEMSRTSSTSNVLREENSRMQADTHSSKSESARPRVFRCLCGKVYKDRESLDNHSPGCRVEGHKDLRNPKVDSETKQSHMKECPDQGQKLVLKVENRRKSANVSDDREKARSEDLKDKKVSKSQSVRDDQIQRQTTSVSSNSRLPRPPVCRCVCGKVYKDRESLGSHSAKCSFKDLPRNY